MKNFNLAIATLVVAAVMSGCSLSKMIKLAAQQDLQVNPSPLELHGGKVSYNLSAVLPPKMLPSGKVYTINNFYQYGDKEIETGSVEFKASDFPNSSSSTSRKSGDFSFEYAPEMNPGKLFVEGVASDPKSGKSAKSPKMEVAVGIITTSLAVKDVYLAAYADHGYNDREEIVPTNVNFFFEQGRSNLVGGIKTDGLSNTEKQKNLAAFIADKNITRTVTITGTHSPEGTERINRNLSADRAKQIETYYRQQMKKYNYKGLADSIKFILKPVVEDWTSLKTALRTYSGVSDDAKNKMIRVVDGSGSFEDKEKELRKIDGYDKVFKEVYPSLRAAKTEILTVKVKKTSAEISVLAKQIVDGKASPDTLTNEEFLFAATLTPSFSEKQEIYKAATKRDGSWVAHNNLGASYLDMARNGAENKIQLVQDAITQLEIAANKSSKPEVHANLASAYIMQGEYKKAYESLVKAESGASNELKSEINALKGVAEIRTAQYESAKASLAGAKTSETTAFNRGLVSLLTKDYNAANDFFTAATGGAIKADAYYYKAVACARAKNATDVIKNLKDAIAADSSMKEKALSDLEFVNFADAVAQAIR